MRKTGSPKLAAQRLVEIIPNVTLEGRVVVYHGAVNPVRFTEQASWALVLGILCDLAEMAGLEPGKCLEACVFHPRTANVEGEVAYTLRDTGWKSQAIRWMLNANEFGYGVVLFAP